MAEELVGSDLDVESGQSRFFAGPVFINGWVTLRGSLECSGDMRCLGMTLAGSLKCRELFVNVLDVASGASVEALRVRARVVQHGRLALRDAVDADTVKADYIQHVGDGAGPDYVRGVLPLTPDFFEPRDSNAPVVIDWDRVREAFRTGKSVFKSRDFLVQPKSKAVVAAATRDPLVEELSRWLDMHPGPQRATIEAVGAEWLPRLTEMSADARKDAAFVIRRAIKSPKLADLVEAICVALLG